MRSRLDPQVSEAEQRQQLPYPGYVDEIEQERLRRQTEAEEDVFPVGQIRREEVGLQRAWWREQVNGPRGLRKTIAFTLALAYLLIGLLSPVTSLVSFAIGRLIAVMGGPANLNPYSQSLWMQVFSAMIYALPVIAVGAILAHSAPRNAVRGAMLASAVKFSVAVLNLAMFGLMYRMSNPSLNFANWQAGMTREVTEAVLLIGVTWLWVRRMRQDR